MALLPQLARLTAAGVLASLISWWLLSDWSYALFLGGTLSTYGALGFLVAKEVTDADSSPRRRHLSIVCCSLGFACAGVLSFITMPAQEPPLVRAQLFSSYWAMTGLLASAPLVRADRRALLLLAGPAIFGGASFLGYYGLDGFVFDSLSGTKKFLGGVIISSTGGSVGFVILVHKLRGFSE